MNLMNLNEKLTDLRKAKGLTQQDIAEALNVSRQALRRMSRQRF